MNWVGVHIKANDCLVQSAIDLSIFNVLTFPQQEIHYPIMIFLSFVKHRTSAS